MSQLVEAHGMAAMPASTLPREEPAGGVGGVRGPEPFRIVMLVPHEPSLDPRVTWVAQLCATLGRTDVLGAVPHGPRVQVPGKADRQCSGKVYVERVSMPTYASRWTKAVSVLVETLATAGRWRRVLAGPTAASSGAPTAITEHGLRPGSHGLIAAARHLSRFLRGWAFHLRLVSALARRVRAVSVVPQVMICHDWPALAAAVSVKKRLRCRIIYDAHEFWPEADLLARSWERRVLWMVERWLVRKADAVVTVSPQLARHLESQYGLSHVISAPNAEPRRTERPRRAPRGAGPVRFLFQGRVTERRGVEQLLHTWRTIADGRGVLYVRCPENEYFSQLRAHYCDLIERGRVVVLGPVPEEDLVSSAEFADVGIVPYSARSLNHRYCCPNKLSQYMQAGLAVLSNDLVFVSDVIQRYRCGRVYDAARPDSFRQAIAYCLDHPEELEGMKARALHAAQTEFNWEVQSAPYAELIRRYSGRLEAGA